MNGKSENIGRPKTVRGRGARLLEGSVILRALMRFVNFVYYSASRSMACLLFATCGEDSEPGDCWLVRAGRRFRDKFLLPIKRGCIRSFERSRILTAIRLGVGRLTGVRLRTYGTFFLSFGLYTALMYVLGSFAFRREVNDLMDLLIGAGCFGLSLPLLFSEESLAKAVCGSRIMRFLLFRVIGIRRESLEDAAEEPAAGKNNIAFVYGMIVGVITYFVPLLYLLAAAAALAVLLLLLTLPETGVVLLIFAVPFMSFLPHPSLLSAGLVFLIALSYLLKLIRGKRSLRFRALDGFILLFMLMTLCGGLFSVSPADTLQPALLYACFAMGYFLVVNLIRTSEWVMRCIAAAVSSSVLVSLYGIYQYLSGNANTKWQDETMFSEISGRVISTFENPNVLAEYLIMVLPLAIALMLTQKKTSVRLLSAAAAAAGLGCLIFTWSRGAWLGFMIGLLIFMLIYSRKTMLLVLAGLAVIPFLPFILPQSIITRFTSIGDMADSSTAYRVHIWQASVHMIQDFFAGGIGVGNGAFKLVYPSYTLAGIESAPHSHNLYLQITIELGIFGLAVFVIAAILFVRGCLSFCRKPGGFRTPQLLCAAGMSGVLAVLAQGMTDYIWYNYRINLMMWLMIGLTIAIRRGCYREEGTASPHLSDAESGPSLELPLAR